MIFFIASNSFLLATSQNLTSGEFMACLKVVGIGFKADGIEASLMTLKIAPRNVSTLLGGGPSVSVTAEIDLTNGKEELSASVS